jgi:hypothetical protein
MQILCHFIWVTWASWIWVSTRDTAINPFGYQEKIISITSLYHCLLLPRKLFFCGDTAANLWGLGSSGLHAFLHGLVAPLVQLQLHLGLAIPRDSIQECWSMKHNTLCVSIMNPCYCPCARRYMKSTYHKMARWSQKNGTILGLATLLSWWHAIIRQWPWSH